MSDEDIITEAELAAQIKRMQDDHLISVGDDRRFAAEVFEGVRCNREPEYEPGAVYQDRYGDCFKRCANPIIADSPWIGFTGELYEHEHPVRPLRKLVPEEDARASEREHIRQLALSEAAEKKNSGLDSAFIASGALEDFADLIREETTYG